MGVLSDDIYNDDWRVELAMQIANLYTNPSQEAFDVINSICGEHFMRNDRKLNWNKNRYIAVSHPMHSRHNQTHVIIAADEDLIRGHGWRTYVYKWTGPTGPKDRRAQWHRVHRGQDNPVLSTGYKFSEYIIYILPEDAWNVLWDILPKRAGDFE